MWDQLWIDLHAATLAADATDYGCLEDAAIGVADGRIAWIGRRADLPGAPATLARSVHSAGRRWVTPGLVDCHTHLVFGGDRTLDQAMRAAGATYAAIAAAGGGIRSTVAMTQSLSVEELVAVALPRARALVADGVTTLEIKSGYGLNVEAELKQLRAARRLGEEIGVDVQPTLLALHALPVEYANDRAGFVDRVCRELIPAAHAERLAVAVDVFCESIAFTVAECERALRVATDLGLAVKVHADQLSDMNAAALAADFGALSADHVEYTSKAGVARMAASGTTAVLLPGAFLLLNEKQRPPVAEFRARGVPMALSTDCNPGTSPVTSLALMVPLGCALFGLSPLEALTGVTRHAAGALGLGADRGTLERGRRADFALWEIGHPRELAYWVGGGRCRGTVRGGEPQH